MISEATTHSKTRYAFIKFPKAIIKDPSMPEGERLLYAVLLAYEWQGSARASLEEMAQTLGLKSVEPVRQRLRGLEGRGLIERIRTGKRRKNSYRILPIGDCQITGGHEMPQPPKSAPSDCHISSNRSGRDRQENSSCDRQFSSNSDRSRPFLRSLRSIKTRFEGIDGERGVALIGLVEKLGGYSESTAREATRSLARQADGNLDLVYAWLRYAAHEGKASNPFVYAMRCVQSGEFPPDHTCRARGSVA